MVAGSSMTKIIMSGTTVVFLWAIPSKVIHWVNIVFMYLCVQNSWQWINITPPFSRISSSWRSNAITCSGMYLATQLIESHWGLWTTLLPTLHRFHGNPYAQVIKTCLDEQISPVTKKRWTLCAFIHIAKCYRLIAKCHSSILRTSYRETYRQLRARRALMLFKDVPLRTRRALLVYKSL